MGRASTSEGPCQGLGRGVGALGSVHGGAPFLLPLDLSPGPWMAQPTPSPPLLCPRVLSPVLCLRLGVCEVGTGGRTMTDRLYYK